MIKREFTFLKEAIARYQQQSNRILRQSQNQLPDQIEQLAMLLDAQPLYTCQLVASKARDLKQAAQEIAETLYLANDFACDKANEIVVKAENL